MRKAIDDHYADTGKYPAELEDLVKKRYLRKSPSTRLPKAATPGADARRRQQDRRPGHHRRTAARGEGLG
ncbi:MAG: hypothetical protein M0C28_17740 [Candidatus Moduliflexus flocculans]|nr:hypothetical protein [Candidatus Moduliflexus flocculans]